MVEELVRQTRPVCGHEIHGLDRAQGDHVVVAAPIAHHSNRAYGQKHRECLAHTVVEIVTAQLLDEDGIGTPQELGVLPAHLAEDTHTEPWARERMAVDHLPRQAELDSQAPYLVLEQLAQRLDELEMHALGESTDVVMRLDDMCLAGARAG